MSIVLDGTTGLAGAATGALNGTLGATTPSTVVATTVVASSTIKGATTIAVGNATPSASGAGITFPATQSASTDANTLDDYEEGTWTPVIVSGSGTITAYTANGYYVKVGRTVTITFGFTITTVGTAGGQASWSGAPFTSINCANNRAATALLREDSGTGVAYQLAMTKNATTGTMCSMSFGNLAWANSYEYVASWVYETA